MPFSSNANNFFSRVPNERTALSDTQLPLEASLRTNAIQVPNLFSVINQARNNELDRKVKQVQLSKILSELNNPIDNNLKEAQIQALKDKSEYQVGLLQNKEENLNRLLEQQTLIKNLIGGSGINGENLPPGSTARIGGFTIPLNQKLTESEQASVAGAQSLSPVVDRIKNSVNNGIFGKDSIQRTLRQSIIDSGNTLLSSQDRNLQSFQQDLAQLKRLIPFTDGGKALTEIEKKLVFSLLNTTGKNNEQVIKDVKAATDLINRKGGLAIGGRNAAIKNESSNNLDYEDLLKSSGF